MGSPPRNVTVRKSSSVLGDNFTFNWKLNRQTGCFSESANSLEVTVHFSLHACSLGPRLPTHAISPCNNSIEYEDYSYKSRRLNPSNDIQFPLKKDTITIKSRFSQVRLAQFSLVEAVISIKSQVPDLSANLLSQRQRNLLEVSVVSVRLNLLLALLLGCREARVLIRTNILPPLDST